MRAELEVSVVAVPGSTPWRKGQEAVQIALFRQEYGRSPTVNFGRMPKGFRMSSGNNAKLVSAGKRFRGGRCEEAEAGHAPSLPPTGPLDAALQVSRLALTDRAWFGEADRDLGVIGVGQLSVVGVVSLVRPSVAAQADRWRLEQPG
jgi:hypothetical protein